jgi:putative membrane protein
MKRIGILSIACAAVITIGCGNNDRANDRSDVAANNETGTVGTAGDNANTPSNGDRDFANDVAIANMAEIELGKMAAERGLSADVKRFGQMMVTDHTKAGEEFKQATSRFNLAPPAGLDDEHRDLQEKLSKLQGAEFDREYMAAMVEGHEDVNDKLESRVDSRTLAEWKTKVDNLSADVRGTERGMVMGVEPERSDNAATMAINQWAATTLPAVRMHLDAARMIKEKVDNSGRNATQ